MKKTILLAFAALLLQPVFSQSEKYIGAMKKNIGEIDSAFVQNEATRLNDIAATFERIGDAEKTQWLQQVLIFLQDIRAMGTINHNDVFTGRAAANK